MDAIQLIITALVAGATAAIEGTAGQAVEDAYQGLKQIISNRYSGVSADVEQLESQPESQDLRKQLIEMGLKSTDAAADTALHQHAKTLLDAIQAELQAEPNKVIGINLEDIEAASMNLSNVIAQGGDNTDTTIGVNVDGAKLPGDLNISDVTATNRPGLPQQPVPDDSSQSSGSSSSSQSKIKILFLAANPSSTTRLRIDEEIRGIDQALLASSMRERFELIPHGAVRVEDLQPLLMRHDPHIVHFSGHGEQNEIILQDASGQSFPVSGGALAGLFGILKDNIRCVVLNACYSEPQAVAINQHIDVVIGMSDAILDESARHFAHSFYQALGHGEDLQRAFDLGKNIIDLQNLGEAHKPKMIHKVDPGTINFAAGE